MHVGQFFVDDLDTALILRGGGRCLGLDRLKVGALLQPLLDMSQAGSLVESTIQQLGTCELDLKQFTKTGAPFLTLRPTFPEVGEAKP